MGGGYYDGDVGTRSRSTRREVFTYRGYDGADAEAAKHPERRECHKDLNIKGKTRECCESKEHPRVTPIVPAMDLTRSRGKDTSVIWSKLPMFIGQLYMKNYVDHPEICWIGIGDASSGDQAPIQVAQFESDNLLDEHLAKMWIEEGGGGTGQESYELAAYAGACLMKLDCFEKRGEKGYWFFLGDEGFYPAVKRDQLKVWLGVDVKNDIPSEQVFRDLQKKFHVFFIFPKKSWEERKKDIDAEMKKRVEQAGGQYQDVDIRASLLWNNRNDLDLHCLTPQGAHIYYGDKRACRYGGFLDVDMNVMGETTKPVENTRWRKGEAPSGHYQFWVELYRNHEHVGETPWRAEIQIGEEVQHFEGKVRTEHAKVKIFEFDYDRQGKQARADEADYALYRDEVVKAQWAGVIPEQNILTLDDPKGIVDLMLGAIAITSGKVNLDEYIKILKDDIGQSESRQRQIRGALELYAKSGLAPAVDLSRLPVKKNREKSGSKTKRL